MMPKNNNLDMSISEIASSIKWSLNGGPFGSKLISKMYVESGVPVIRGANLPLDQRFYDDDFVYVSETKAQELRAHNAKPGDVIFTQRGTLGQVGIIPLDARYPIYVISQSQMKLTVDERMVDPFYIYYAFRSKEISCRFVSLASTSGVPHVNLQTLRDFTIPIPPLETQRRIASILGAYDDLIEVNRRRIKLLEEMARGMFEEWFVRFRFPGHETTPLHDTPNGPLPEGWHLGTLNELAKLDGQSINPGGAPDQIFAHYSLPAFDGSRSPALEYGEAIKSNKLAFNGPIILISKLNPRIPRVWYVLKGTDQPQIASTEFVPILAKGSCTLAWLYAAIRNPHFTNRLIAMAGGTSTSHQRVKPKDILSTPIVIPDDLTLRRTSQIFAPIFEMAGAIETASSRLAASRDLLLPRLISGQLSVAAAEQQLAAE